MKCDFLPRSQKIETLMEGDSYNLKSKFFLTKIMYENFLSIVVSEPFVEKTINAILESAYTGEVGDGKIFVLPVEEAYRIRTKETGKTSLN